jgi:hypothetical protein
LSRFILSVDIRTLSILCAVSILRTPAGEIIISQYAIKLFFLFSTLKLVGFWAESTSLGSLQFLLTGWPLYTPSSFFQSHDQSLGRTTRRKNIVAQRILHQRRRQRRQRIIRISFRGSLQALAQPLYLLHRHLFESLKQTNIGRIAQLARFRVLALPVLLSGPSDGKVGWPQRSMFLRISITTPVLEMGASA